MVLFWGGHLGSLRSPLPAGLTWGLWGSFGLVGEALGSTRKSFRKPGEITWAHFERLQNRASLVTNSKHSAFHVVL